MDHTPDPAADPDAAGRPHERHHDVDVRVRRTPKFGAFMLIGAVVGALVAWALSAVQAPGVNVAGEPVDTSGVQGLAIIIGIVLGLGAGAIVALIVDRSLSKRGRVLVAEQTDTEAAEEPQAAVSPTDAGEASFEPLAHAAAEDVEPQPQAGETAAPGQADETATSAQADGAAPAERADGPRRDGESGERDRPGGA